MKTSFVQPRPELRPYLRAIWILQTAAGSPSNDAQLAAPNGCPKLIILCDNELATTAQGRTRVSRPGLYVVGNRDVPVFVGSTPQSTTVIGFEFRPYGAFPLFRLPMHEMANRVLDWQSIFGTRDTAIRETIAFPSIAQQIDFAQAQLLSMFNGSRPYSRLVKYCVAELERTAGGATIHHLAQKTGVSRRYLQRLFNEQVGFAPMALGRIFRFQRFYQMWATGVGYDSLIADVQDHYYDQAHFIKEFKSMTAYSPRRFIREVSNELGRRLCLPTIAQRATIDESA